MVFNRIAVLGAAAAAAVVVGLSPPALRAQTPPQLTFTVEAAVNEAPGKVNFNLTYRRNEHSRSTVGRTAELSELSGLSAGQFNTASPTPVAFRITRDAGGFVCQGSARARLASGVCDFEPSAVFTRSLEQRGAGHASEDQLLALAMGDIGFAFLEEMRRQRYPAASVDELVNASHHGVGMKMLQGMAAAGYRVGDLAALIRLRDHGVSPTDVADLKVAGVSVPAAEDLVRLRDHGVSARYITDLKAAGYAGLSADRLVYLRDHGVSASYIQGLQTVGYAGVPVDELVRLRDHGVTAEFIRRYADGQRLDVEALIQLRNRGGRRD